MEHSLLISCPGVYDNHGVGSGGLVCFHKGSSLVIDNLDTTGISIFNDHIYRYIRLINKLAVYDINGFIRSMELDGAKDVHFIKAHNDGIICVSTGTNEIKWFDHDCKLSKNWKAEGDGDAWHLNSLVEKDGNIMVTAFGEFQQHREWVN
ncbi:MAG: hypothetical protein IH946_00035, partial [Bacteroidetes bacterium]|nr:hypothetical protein [Bacteroidota bacterium]